MKCANCGKCGKEQAKSDRLPRGWKRAGEKVLCKACWNNLYVLRAVTFPVAGPLDAASWPDLRNALAVSWADTTRLANWITVELIKTERVRLPNDVKFWKPLNLYLYPQARQMCPNLSPSSVVAILNTVQAKFNKMRFNVIWNGSSALPMYRYPMPYPLPAQAWSARWLTPTEHVPVVSVTIQGVRFDLRLRGGSEFKRQLGSFSALVNGEAFPCELALYRKLVNQNSNRSVVAEHLNDGGGEKGYNRVMCKLVMWLPRQINNGNSGSELILRRGEDCFWIAQVEKRDPWILNCDWVRSWIIGHKIRLQRMSDDTKFEKRWPKQNRIHINEFREKACKKQNDRLDSFSHLATKLLAEFAKRQKISVVRYIDEPTSYMPDFPWFKLKELLGYKLRERGIAYEISNAARDC